MILNPSCAHLVSLLTIAQSCSYLNDLHMKQAEETASEPKAHGIVDLWLVVESGVIQLQLPQSLSEVLRGRLNGVIMAWGIMT